MSPIKTTLSALALSLACTSIAQADSTNTVIYESTTPCDSENPDNMQAVLEIFQEVTARATATDMNGREHVVERDVEFYKTREYLSEINLNQLIFIVAEDEGKAVYEYALTQLQEAKHACRAQAPSASLTQ